MSRFRPYRTITLIGTDQRWTVGGQTQLEAETNAALPDAEREAAFYRMIATLCRPEGATEPPWSGPDYAAQIKAELSPDQIAQLGEEVFRTTSAKAADALFRRSAGADEGTTPAQHGENVRRDAGQPLAAGC